jgi:N-acetyl-gamma-glutamyl-phosphate reductase
LGLNHKHVPEMQAQCGLAHPPLFAPSVIPAHRGMWVEVPLQLSAMPHAASAQALREGLAQFYETSAVVSVAPASLPDEILLRGAMPPSDALTLHVFASADGAQARLVAVLDNLGKGASGAAVQSLNLMAGLPETAGLAL